MYTSGSTGFPKGVRVGHAALSHTLRTCTAKFAVGPGTRLVHVVPFAFDVSVACLLMPLLQGGCVVVAAERQVQCGDLLKELMQRHNVNACIATPTLWHMLLAAGWMVCLSGTCERQRPIADTAITKISCWIFA